MIRKEELGMIRKILTNGKNQEIGISEIAWEGRTGSKENKMTYKIIKKYKKKKLKLNSKELKTNVIVPIYYIIFRQKKTFCKY